MMDSLLATVPDLKSIERHQEISSTNTRAAKLAHSTATITPLLIFANKQTDGRGRGNHSWWSSEGALTFSLLVDGSLYSSKANTQAKSSDIDYTLIPAISLATALAVTDTLSDFAPSTNWGIKWPNDIVVRDKKLKKVAGILIETPAVSPPCPARMVLGIGINVNNHFEQAPKNIHGIATSLLKELNQTVDLELFLATLLKHLFRRIKQVSVSTPDLSNNWQQKCALQGREISLQHGSNIFQGMCRGLNSCGALLLETSKGEQAFVSGSILSIDS